MPDKYLLHFIKKSRDSPPDVHMEGILPSVGDYFNLAPSFVDGHVKCERYKVTMVLHTLSEGDVREEEGRRMGKEGLPQVFALGDSD